MDGMLSQEEINALLNEPDGSDLGEQPLTDTEKDAIGEVANISMGTAATTLFSLVNRKVDISTPVVSFATWEDIVAAYERPCVFIRIGYTVGLDGSNVLVLKDRDVKVITDLMMGGDGTNTDGNRGFGRQPDYAVVSVFFCERDVFKYNKEYGDGCEFNSDRTDGCSGFTACSSADAGAADDGSANARTAGNGSADDGSADDGSANARAAGKCPTSAISGICTWQYQSGATIRKY